MTSVERSQIPPTNARLRPDQKALEEGRVEEAENIKLEVDEAQKNRRRQREDDQVCIFNGLETVQGDLDRWKFVVIIVR